MPQAAPKPCTVCRTLVRDGTTRCDAHKVREGSFADSRRGSRHARGYGTAWDKIRERVMQRDAGLCQPCARLGRVTAASEVDHVRSKKRGGTDDEANLQAICKPCHQVKTAAERLGGGGAAISAALAFRTDPEAKFSRAGVSDGGVPQVQAGSRR